MKQSVACWLLLLATLCFVTLLPTKVIACSKHQIGDFHDESLLRVRSHIHYRNPTTTALADNENNGADMNQAGTYQPIRISPQYHELDKDLASNPTMLNKLKSQVIPQALEVLRKSLSVIPAQTPIGYERDCASVWSNGKCASLRSNPTCGDVPIVAQHLLPATVCPSNPSSCSTVAGGTGVSNTDLVIYVAAKQGSCGGNVLAYATSCQRDQNDRPTFGYINICNLFFTDSGSDQYKLGIVIHELMHALGFASSSFAFFRNSDGTPRTPRDANGQPRYDQAARNFIPSSNTLITQAVRGGAPVSKLVTPNVVKYARQYFNCPTLDGLELEDGGASGTAGSHWNSRLLFSELMAGQAYFVPFLSRMTLALFEDSGWYRANYSNANPEYQFGKGKGCPFINNKCINNGQSIDSSTFCTQNGQQGCTADTLAKGVCSLYSYSSNLPAYMQYFSDPKQGGPNLVDFCPIVNGYSNGRCQDANNLGSIANGRNYQGENYCENCRCFSSSLLSNRYVFQNKVNPGCYARRCSRTSTGAIKLEIQVESTWYACTPGAKLKIAGYNGELSCPSNIAQYCMSMQVDPLL